MAIRCHLDHVVAERLEATAVAFVGVETGEEALRANSHCVRIACDAAGFAEPFAGGEGENRRRD